MIRQAFILQGLIVCHVSWSGFTLFREMFFSGDVPFICCLLVCSALIQDGDVQRFSPQTSELNLDLVRSTQTTPTPAVTLTLTLTLTLTRSLTPTFRGGEVGVDRGGHPAPPRASVAFFLKPPARPIGHPLPIAQGYVKKRFVASCIWGEPRCSEFSFRDGPFVSILGPCIMPVGVFSPEIVRMVFGADVSAISII